MNYPSGVALQVILPRLGALRIIGTRTERWIDRDGAEGSSFIDARGAQVGNREARCDLS